MISSNETDENLFGKVIVYDLESNELKSIDEYAVYNIVQFITPVGESGLAYYYYENETQDWIVKYYDMSTNVSEEIFRHTNFNDLQISPVAITSDGSDTALVIQYVQDDTYHTQLAWINSDGNLYKAEEIDLYNFFDTEDYEITDFKINNNYYLIKALVQDEEEYFFFDRDNNSFHVILPAICHLNSLIGYSITNESDILFNQNVKVLGNLINVNLPDNSFCTYEFPYEFIENNTINYLKANANNDLIIFYGTDSSNYSYQIIQDYKSIETTPMNPGLYISPREQYEHYANSDFATEEGMEELKQSMETQEKEMSDNDFRWRFVYQNY